MCAEAFNLRLRPVAVPGKAIARFRQVQVDYLVAIAELARRPRGWGPRTGDTVRRREPRDSSATRELCGPREHLVDKALVRWLEHPEQFTQELFQRVGLIKDHGRVLAREVDWTRRRGVRM
jgi:hypothetical protein